MTDIGTVAGLGALGFWLFITTIIAAGVWDNIRKREAKHETLRRIVESGQPLDDSLVDKLLSLTDGGKNQRQELKTAGVILLFVALGLTLMGWIMSITLSEEMFGILAGVSALLICISVGLLLTAYLIGRWKREDNAENDHWPEA